MQRTRVAVAMDSPPQQALEKILHRPVRVQLKDGRSLFGKLLGCDEHLNMVLDEVEESADEARRRLGRVLVRGSNILTLHAADGPLSKP